MYELAMSVVCHFIIEISERAGFAALFLQLVGVTVYRILKAAESGMFVLIFAIVTDRKLELASQTFLSLPFERFISSCTTVVGSLCSHIESVVIIYVPAFSGSFCFFVLTLCEALPIYQSKIGLYIRPQDR